MEVQFLGEKTLSRYRSANLQSEREVDGPYTEPAQPPTLTLPDLRTPSQTELNVEALKRIGTKIVLKIHLHSSATAPLTAPQVQRLFFSTTCTCRLQSKESKCTQSTDQIVWAIVSRPRKGKGIDDASEVLIKDLAIHHIRSVLKSGANNSTSLMPYMRALPDQPAASLRYLLGGGAGRVAHGLLHTGLQDSTSATPKLDPEGQVNALTKIEWPPTFLQVHPATLQAALSAH
ncbi:hypothetical protein B0H19DRAFT_1083994 [Mycena capillaripes]|nr:hypothetical protein B0H19DRAFT_1083994 [Mycena capillaripes]